MNIKKHLFPPITVKKYIHIQFIMSILKLFNRKLSLTEVTTINKQIIEQCQPLQMFKDASTDLELQEAKVIYILYTLDKTPLESFHHLHHRLVLLLFSEINKYKLLQSQSSEDDTDTPADAQVHPGTKGIGRLKGKAGKV